MIAIRYYPVGTMPDALKRDVDRIDAECLAGDSDDPAAYEADMYDWEAPEDGMYLLLDDDKAVGRVAVHKSASVYEGKAFLLGGFGGLAVLPEYRGRGYGRQLAEMALARAAEIGIDVACMCVNMDSGITAFYERLGYAFLRRPAHFTNWQNREKTDNTVMLRAVGDPALTARILAGEGRFFYGECKGHW